jgi:pyruvate/2-oxoglutarate dehydrogenase complex dihydrolipoamide dehydrogenase (E3) component
VIVLPLGQTSESFARNSLLWLDGKRFAPEAPTTIRAALATRLGDFNRERSLQRLPGLNVQAIEGPAAFTSSREIKAGEIAIRARRFLLATGRHSPAFGVESPFLAEGELPRALRVLGGGGHAVTLAQVLVHAGFGVALDAPEGLLPDIDPEAAALLSATLMRDGIRILVPGTAEAADAALLPTLDLSAFPAALDGLGLDQAGIALDKGELILDDRLRTSNSRVFAIGALTTRDPLATPGAAQIGYLIAKLLIRKPGRYHSGVSLRRVPTFPEIVTLGQTEREARRGGTAISLFREAVPGGFVKAIADKKLGLLGVTIIAENAAELAMPWALAMQAGGSLAGLAGLPPLPGQPADAARLIALTPSRKMLASPRLQSLVRFMRNFG